MNFDLHLTFKLTLLWLYFGKSCKTTPFRKPTEVAQNTSTFISIGLPITKNSLLKIWKICVLLAAPFSNDKIADIWNFQWIKNLSKGLLYLEKCGVGVNYCWSCGPSKLLLHFIQYRLDDLNSKHTKIAVNSAVQYFEGCCQKKCLLKVWSFLVHPPQNRGPVKLLQN